MCLLYIGKLQDSYYWWNFVLNFFCESRRQDSPTSAQETPPPPKSMRLADIRLDCAFLAFACIMFVLIFIEYFQTRRLLRRMDSRQRREYTWQPSDGPIRHGRSGSSVTSVVTMGRARADSGAHFGALQQREGGIYDKYLIIRTLIPLLALW